MSYKDQDPYLRDVWENCDAVDAVAFTLNSIARAFYVTGNSEMGDRLSECSSGLIGAAKGILLAVGEEINRNCDSATKNTAEILTAILHAGESK